MNSPTDWTFYGRDQEVQTLRDLLLRDRWFFVRVSGRRRIGKTALVRQALRAAGRERVAFLQIDDSDPIGVVATARRHLALLVVGRSEFDRLTARIS